MLKGTLQNYLKKLTFILISFGFACLFLQGCGPKNFLSAHTARKSGNYDKAIELYTQILEDDLSTHWKMATYQDRGIAYYETEQYHNAIEDFNKAIALKPKHTIKHLYSLRASSYGRTGQYELAISDYSTLISWDPDEESAYYGRGLIYEHMFQLDLALADAEKRVSLVPGGWARYLNRGNLFAQKDNFGHALKDFEKAISLRPYSAAPYNDRGFTYLRMGEYQKAITDFDKAISLNPNFSNPFNNRGITNFYLNKFNQSIKDFEAFQRLNPDNIFAAVWLHLAKKRLGQSGKQDLKPRYQNKDEFDWPAPLIPLYLGKLLPGELFKKIKNKDKFWVIRHRCVGFFHLGQYYLLRGNKNMAEESFRKSIATEAKDVIEYTAAKEELKRLQ